jgi:hypothetical protein
MRRPQASLFVPTSSIVTTTERSFVILVRNGISEWVDVKRGVQTGNSIEVFGDLQAGDLIVRRGSDEIQAGTRVNPQSLSNASN